MIKVSPKLPAGIPIPAPFARVTRRARQRQSSPVRSGFLAYTTVCVCASGNPYDVFS
jgi:hypothetical protein